MRFSRPTKLEKYLISINLEAYENFNAVYNKA